MSLPLNLASQQKTLQKSVTLAGVGVHSGAETRVTLNPAPAQSGIVFVINGNEIPASYVFVTATQNATVLSGANNSSLCTIEHLMAAFAGLEIDNCRVDVEGSEIPVLDGSSAVFVEAISRAGVVSQNSPRRYIKILKTIEVKMGESFARLEASEKGFVIDVTLDYANPAIGRSRFATQVTPDIFVKEVSGARTFGFYEDYEKLQKAGLAKGSSLENTVVFKEGVVVNAEGLRFEDECVRHKWLDALGDLSLAGAPLLGKYTSYKGGHKLNSMMLEALFADSSAYCFYNSPVAQMRAGVAVSTVLAA
jgi:UDP-3-O-[3-hydroxymyristoyl] N-acetylglucosamine deacetylase